MDNPLDANAEITNARQCVARCRWRIFLSLLFSAAILLSVIIGNQTGIGIFPLVMCLLIGSACCAVMAIISGMTYLLKYRHTKQGIFSIISGTTLGIILMPLPCLLMIPSTHSPHRVPPRLFDIKQAGLVLFIYANENNGEYPSDLAAFLKTEFFKTNFDPSDTDRYFYKKGSDQLRWILTPGLTTSDDPRTVLLQAADRDKNGGLIIFTVGLSLEHIKNPDKNIIIVSGKPMLRGK